MTRWQATNSWRRTTHAERVYSVECPTRPHRMRPAPNVRSDTAPQQTRASVLRSTIKPPFAEASIHAEHQATSKAANAGKRDEARRRRARPENPAQRTRAFRERQKPMDGNQTPATCVVQAGLGHREARPTPDADAGEKTIHSGEPYCISARRSCNIRATAPPPSQS